MTCSYEVLHSLGIGLKQMLQNVAPSAALKSRCIEIQQFQILNSNCVDNLLGSYVHTGIILFL
jgi:hypothetical protein